MNESTTGRINKIMAGILLLLFAIVLYGGWLILAPVTVVKPNIQPYKIATPTIQAGEPVVYVADVCKYRAVFSTATRDFVDSNGVHYPLPAQYSNLPTGCSKTDVAIPTPLNLHSGTWYLDLEVQYKVNIFKTKTYHFRTDNFTVTNPILK
jgi:hypothetical protein